MDESKKKQELLYVGWTRNVLSEKFWELERTRFVKILGRTF